MTNPFVILFLIFLFILAISRFDEIVGFLTSSYTPKTTDETWTVIDMKRY